jgi:hypothetical protein
MAEIPDTAEGFLAACDVAREEARAREQARAERSRGEHTCASCGEPIEGGHIVSRQGHFHPECVDEDWAPTDWDR